MYLGTAPTGRYARMSFADRHALVTRAKVSMSAETQQDLKDAYQEVVDTGTLPTDDKGMTAIDKARLFLQPNQIKRAELQFEEARMMHEAVAPLRDMTDRQVVDHLNRIRDPKATGERAALARKVSQAAERAWAEIEAERLADPVEAIDPYTNVRTQRAGKTKRADEVTGAYDLIKRRHPNVQTRQSASGALEIADPEDATPEQWAEVHRARRTLIDARIEAQARLNIPPANRSPISQREARELLQLPEVLGEMQRGDLVMRLRDAGDRAEIKYGKEMGPIVFQAALRYHTTGTAELKQEKTFAINRLLSGAEIKRSDIKRLEDLQQLERRRNLFNMPTPEEGRAPRPDLPPIERPAPKPSGGSWWPFGSSSSPAPKAAQPAPKQAPQQAPANPLDALD